MPPIVEESFGLSKLTERQKHWALLQAAAESSLSRRNFLRYLSSATALLSSSGCQWGMDDEAVTFIEEPSKMSSQPVYLATAEERKGFGQGILVELFNGRPIKIEGQSKEAVSRGATDAVMQAQLLNLYHPSRLKAPASAKPLSTKMFEISRELTKTQGADTVVVLPASTSEWRAEQVRSLKLKWPKAQVVMVSADPVFTYLKSTEQVFGEALWPVFHLERASTTVSFDVDLFSELPAHLKHIRDFADHRTESGSFHRLLSVASVPSLTTAMADEHFFLSPPSIERVVNALLMSNLKHETPIATNLKADENEVFQKLKRQFERGTLWIPSPTLPLASQAQVWGLNSVLASAGISYLSAKDLGISEVMTYVELESFLQTTNPSRFLIFGEDVVSHVSENSKLSELLKTSTSVYFGTHKNRTSEKCNITVPVSHFLEASTDLKTPLGEQLISQACLNPLFGTQSVESWLKFLTQQSFATPIEFEAFVLKRYGLDAEALKQSLARGGTLGGSLKSLNPRPQNLVNPRDIPPLKNDQLILSFRNDPYIGSGEYAHNEWLQELPRPVTRLTWDNAIAVSKAKAKKHALENGSLIKVHLDTAEGEAARSLELPVVITDYLPDHLTYIYLGYHEPQGFALTPLRRTSDTWWVKVRSFEKTSKTYSLALAQVHFEPGEDPPVVVLETDHLKSGHTELKKRQKKFKHQLETLRDSKLLKLMQESKVQWAMTIDLSRCVGCGTCVIACQAENNIPAVGKLQMLHGRQMHWIRIDNYVSHIGGKAQLQFQPVPCMHCEKAPCEEVCPVAATVHGQEGLNQMIYNRCVGTRFCANNCPYKVRRFNYYKYSSNFAESEKALLNPEVSVRPRGVMEKCTYCVQRIKSANDADKVQTACQQACPAQAIQFGNMQNPKAKVSVLRQSPRHYPLLVELGTLPRTTYLARLHKGGKTS